MASCLTGTQESAPSYLNKPQFLLGKASVHMYMQKDKDWIQYVRPEAQWLHEPVQLQLERHQMPCQQKQDSSEEARGASIHRGLCGMHAELRVLCVLICFPLENKRRPERLSCFHSLCGFQGLLFGSDLFWVQFVPCTWNLYGSTCLFVSPMTRTCGGMRPSQGFAMNVFVKTRNSWILSHFLYVLFLHLGLSCSWAPGFLSLY